MAALTVPMLPTELTLALPTHLEAKDAATDQAVTAFLSRDYTHPTRDDLGHVHVRSLEKKIEAGSSRHTSAIGAVVGLLKDARAGIVNPDAYLDALKQVFLGAATRAGHGEQGETRSLPGARSEWGGILSWAVAQAEDSDPEGHRARVTEKFPPQPKDLDDELFEGERAFWDSSPNLTTIYTFALSRNVSPWAVLAVVLIRVCHTIPPGVVLPPIVGSPASLNYFCALVGSSGSGKGAGGGVAREVLPLPADDEPEVEEPASGEGLIAAYVCHRKEKGRDPVQEMYRYRVVFDIPEIDKLTALGSRGGATIDANLRMLWSGEALGSMTSDPSKRRRVEGGTYRAGLIVGVQPDRAEGLFAGSGGGTPQRFIWLPATDPRVSMTPPPLPRPIEYVSPGWLQNHKRTLTVPAEAEQEVRAAAVARNRGQADALDGHALLARLKVAQLLTFLDGQVEMTLHDWERAGVVMTMSDRTRAEAQAAVASQAAGRAKAAGRYDALRSESAAEVAEETATKRVAKVIRRHAHVAGREGISRSDLRKKVTSRDRSHFDAALEKAIEVGDVEVDETTQGQRVTSTEAGS